MGRTCSCTLLNFLTIPIVKGYFNLLHKLLGMGLLLAVTKRFTFRLATEDDDRFNDDKITFRTTAEQNVYTHRYTYSIAVLRSSPQKHWLLQPLLKIFSFTCLSRFKAVWWAVCSHLKLGATHALQINDVYEKMYNEQTRALKYLLIKQYQAMWHIFIIM